MLGVLETIADVESFFTHLRFCKRDVILSYCATDLTGKCDRAALGWVNAFSYFELARLFDRFGFRIECTAPIDSAQALMRLDAGRAHAAAGALPGGGGVGRRRHVRRPAWAQHDQYAAAGRGRGASSDLRHAERGARRLRSGGDRHRRQPVPAADRRRAHRFRRPRQGLDRHFRHAIPRADPARARRAADRAARYLVRALSGRRADVRARAWAMSSIWATG